MLEDIQLVFDNCRLYNESGMNENRKPVDSSKFFSVLCADAEEYECAERLERYFDKMKEELGLSQCLPDGGESEDFV